jgi:hypothetical protein
MDEGRPRPFHERFDIEVGAEEARQRFVNRVSNSVFDSFIYTTLANSLAQSAYYRDVAHRRVANALGLRYANIKKLDDYVRGDFSRCLQVLEALYQYLIDLDQYESGHDFAQRLTAYITEIEQVSEVDLGVRWEPPIFVRTGAQLLDEHLVNEPLRWLSEPQYGSVRKPFSKGLSHYLEATNKPERLADVVTDMYEAVEALAKVVTGKDRDLSKNRESFIKRIQASDYYKQLLKDYIEYGSEYRHAVRVGRPRPPLSEPEVEAFIYLTGLFIRLAIRTT